VVVPFVVFVIHSLLFRSWIDDDAGISFAYARNFIHGLGLVAQCGVEPVEGFSNPLWTLLISPLFIHDPVDPTLYVKCVSWVLMLGTFVVVGMVARLLFRQAWWAQSVTAATLFFVSVNTSVVVWTTSGLENPLYAFLCALYCLQLVKYGEDPVRRTVATAGYAGAVAAGLALTRPDGIVFCAAFPAVVGILLWNDTAPWKTEGRRLAAFFSASAIPVLAYISFRLTYFGDIYPNTYHAKGGPSAGDVAGLAFLTNDHLQSTYELFYGAFSWRAGLFMVVLLFGAFYLLFMRRRTSPLVFLLPVVACTWTIYCLLPSDWMAEYRFATPFLLVLPLVLTSLLADILSTGALRPRVQQTVFVCCVSVLIASSVKVYLPRSFQFAANPTVPFAMVASEYGARFNYYADELGIGEGSLLCPDLGGTLYFSRHRVYDLAGLCDRRIAHIASDDREGLREYVFNLRPTFIHVHDIWSVKAGLHADKRFKEQYEAITEEPCKWARSIGMTNVLSGDYVLREAVRSYEVLERIRHETELGWKKHLSTNKKAVPFPRR
jgi:hypothetical protein